ncbi:MAG TPA: hypothetical protein VFO16_05670 [Pseudonocardiaceae bacterium]|nr:hypothetical protein [Pseudonocardiaceae bacterium]
MVVTRMLNAVNDTVPVTALLVEQRLEHRVTSAAAAAGRRTDRYQAICGRLFIAAALAAPPGPPCPDCAVVLAIASGAATPAAPRPSRRHRDGLLRRLLGPQQRAAIRPELPDRGHHP